jgi:nitroreductase
LSRRRQIGWDLYHQLGIGKGDRAAARRWHDQNFTFFGAPVGMILTTDRRLGLGALIDLGMFLEAVAIAARAFGLETCAQAAFGAYHRTIRGKLALPPEEMVVCGLALGVEDRDAVPNRLRPSRVPPEIFASFYAD